MTDKFEISENSLKILRERYLRKDHEGKIIEHPLDMFRRVARHIAMVEARYEKGEEFVSIIEEEFYDVMTKLYFLPNSPTLMNAGTTMGQLAACFVLPVGDSMVEIFEAVKQGALIHQSGGGTGYSFSRLRPKGSTVRSTQGIASGPISFMHAFDAATATVHQGGKRRGANMGILRVDHPDILEFITCKDDNKKLTNFNISVALTKVFMEALEEDKEYDLINPQDLKIVGTLRARDVFDKIVNQAWKNGEPGVVFLDRINENNTVPGIGEIESTNPCGEQPLLPYESCCLGSINLSRMVKDGQVDWKNLERVTRVAVRFLDNVVDVNKYPLPQIEEMSKSHRKIGLGVMGWADMLIQLGIPYDSEEAINMAETVMAFVNETAFDASVSLQLEKGAFPNVDKSIYKEGSIPRNATRTTIAPTGSLSIIAGCSSGIEPLFGVAFKRKVLNGKELVEVNIQFEQLARIRGFYSESLIEEIAKRGNVKGLKEVPADVQRLFVTAHDISPEWHIRHQAAFQKYTDNAVSKTVNFPNNATPKDVENVYLMAYKSGCKGVTVYRDGSREVQVISRVKEAERESETRPRPRPEVVGGKTWALQTGCGKVYVTVNTDEKEIPFEVFSRLGKSGGCASAQAEAVGRLVSMSLRAKVPISEIIKQIKGISCQNPTFYNGGRILSCADAIAKALEKSIMNIPQETTLQPELPMNLGEGACPDCGSPLVYQEGCAYCTSCGFTRC